MAGRSENRGFHGKGYAMKHVSWVIALVVGFAIGFVGRGALDGGGPRPPPRTHPASPVPRPQRPVEDPRAVYRVPVGESPVKGPADALVTIVESSDFECPFCKRGAATMKQVEAQYGGKVRFVFKHNPLPFHPSALPAAMATEEARAQGGDAKFWAMHDKLFDLAPALDAASLERAATELGLDAAKVKAAVDGKTYKAKVEADQRQVVAVGAPATPTYFINGRKVAGAQPLEAFRAVIDEELKKAEQLVASGTPAAQVYDRLMEKAATAPVYVPGTAPQAQPAAAPGAAPSPEARPSAAAPATSPSFEVPVRADDPARGPKDAKLTVVLFSDFQCPFCGRVEPSLKQLEDAFPGQIRIVWKHQPLSFHPNAIPAALAAEAARDQGKFWPMHAKLFQDQQALSPDLYTRYAKELGLDLKKFKGAIDAKKGQDRIQQDQQLAGRVGANGTPTMFFNCRQVVGAQPFERLKVVAEDELRKADALLAGKKPGADFYGQACGANLKVAAAGPALKLRPDDPVRGNPKAPVTIVLFSDFQCPFCARVNPTLAEVEKTYGEKVKVVWKHQPLPFHPNALPAAEAAEAAREQGKFWQFHDKLFQNQQLLSEDAYDRFAKELGLDVAKFKAARTSGRFKARIQEDQALAAAVGAEGTPTMFVNGTKVVGAQPFEQFRSTVDAALAAVAKR
jgi:protein-disulfide isomerase